MFFEILIWASILFVEYIAITTPNATTPVSWVFAAFGIEMSPVASMIGVISCLAVRILFGLAAMWCIALVLFLQIFVACNVVSYYQTH